MWILSHHSELQENECLWKWGGGVGVGSEGRCRRPVLFALSHDTEVLYPPPPSSELHSAEAFSHVYFYNTMTSENNTEMVAGGHVHFDEDVLTECQLVEDDSDEIFRVSNVMAAPIKRRRSAIDGDTNDEVRKVKRKLFTEDDDMSHQDDIIDKLKKTPTIDQFVYKDQVVNLRGPLPDYEGAKFVLTNVFNTFVHIVCYKSSLPIPTNSMLTIQLYTDKHDLRKLEEDRYENSHIHLPRMLETMLGLFDYRNSPAYYINQLKPVSCLVNKRTMMEKISYRSMEATTKNGSSYIELSFNNPFRFIFFGFAHRQGQQRPVEVGVSQFFGDYIHKTLEDMYEVLYVLVSKEIEKAKRGVKDPEAIAAAPVGGGLQQVERAPIQGGLRDMEMYSNRNSGEPVLHGYLRQVNLPLTKKDNVNILVTSGGGGGGGGGKGGKSAETAKMTYLTVEKNDKEKTGCLKLVDSEISENAVFLSSYIRCRVLIQEQSKFSLQIYTRHGIQLMPFTDKITKFDELDPQNSKPSEKQS